jgi:hypothetical protein
VLDGLRAALDELGLTPFDIRLPDEDPAVAPLKGALQVRADGGRFVLETVDYGRPYRLLDAGSEDEIKEAVIGRVSRPLPPVRAMARPELDTLLGRVAGHYGKLLNDLRTEQGFVIDLPPQLPLDRIGALDGVHIYPDRHPLRAPIPPADRAAPRERRAPVPDPRRGPGLGGDHPALVRAPWRRDPVHPPAA